MRHQNYMMPFQQQLSTNKPVNVATTMLDTAKTRRNQAMENLEKIAQKRKLLIDKQHKLLEKAMSSTANAAKKKRAKSRLPNLQKERKQYSVGLFGCCCSKVVVGFLFIRQCIVDVCHGACLLNIKALDCGTELLLGVFRG